MEWIPDSSFLTSGMTAWRDCIIADLRELIFSPRHRNTLACGYPFFGLLYRHMDTWYFVLHFWYDDVEGQCHCRFKRSHWQPASPSYSRMRVSIYLVALSSHGYQIARSSLLVWRREGSVSLPIQVSSLAVRFTVILAHAGIHLSDCFIVTWIPDSSFLTSGMTAWRDCIIADLRELIFSPRHRNTLACGYPFFGLLYRHMDTWYFVLHFWYDDVEGRYHCQFKWVHWQSASTSYSRMRVSIYLVALSSHGYQIARSSLLVWRREGSVSLPI